MSWSFSFLCRSLSSHPGGDTHSLGGATMLHAVLGTEQLYKGQVLDCIGMLVSPLQYSSHRLVASTFPYFLDTGFGD